MENIKRREKFSKILQDILCGAAIGAAFIIPGFSGGTVAALLGVYERIVDAVADFFKHFKESVLSLFPIAIGMVLGVAALIFPIGWGLEFFPLPTVSLFIGLSLGGLPPLKRRAGKTTKKKLLIFAAAALFTASLAFLPSADMPEGFLYRLGAGGYLLLFLVGLLASCALVVPGISGSMLLLILGYYAPLLSLISELVLFGTQPLTSVFVLAVLSAGIAAGFFIISAAMRYVLKRAPEDTYAAILGFILGSVPCVYASVPLSASPWTWVASFLSLAVGAAASLLFTRYTSSLKRTK